MDRLGLTIGLEGASLGDAVALCRDAEALGYTDIWSAEVGGADAIASLAAVAATTHRPRLGTAIIPVYTRPPALIAMGAATLQDLSGGRFVLGLGTSSSIIVEQWMGGSFVAPLLRLREYVEVLREILAGKKATFEGETVSLTNFRLQHDPRASVPIYLAALGRDACRLAGSVADGVIFFLKTPDGVRQALEWVAEGARSAGREPNDLDCVIRLPVALDEDPETLRFVARRMIATYAQVDVYNRSLTLQGFARQATGISSSWKEGDRDAATQAVDDEMIDALFVSGDSAECTSRLQAFRDAGVKTPVLLPFSVAGDPKARADGMRATVEKLAP